MPLTVTRASPAARTSSPRTFRSITSDTTLDAQLATITTDTGAFAPGHRDFTRYNSPGLCREAAIRARATARRSVAVRILGDTLNSFSDTVGFGAAAQVARTCGARFTLANTPPAIRNDVLNVDHLFGLAVSEQNDSLALALLTSQPNDWVGGMREFVKNDRRAAAQALLARAEAQGSSGRELQRALHQEMRLLYLDQDADLGHLLHEDSIVIRQGMQQIQQRSKETPEAKQAYVDVFYAYRDLIYRAIRNDTTQVMALALAAKRDLGTYRSQWNTIVLDSAMSRLAPSWWAHIHYDTVRLAPRIRADFWWPVPGTTAVPSIPAAGKVNLICNGGVPTNDTDDPSVREFSAYVQAMNIKRWLARYGAAGLVVTVVRAADVSPQINYAPDRTLHEVITKDSVEAAAFWHWYDQTYHELPVNEAVKVIHTTQWLPPPDGRRLTVSEGEPNGYFDLVTAEPSIGELYLRQNECTLVDRDGKILYTYDGQKSNGFFESAEWHGWDDVLQWVFAGNHASNHLKDIPPSSPVRTARSSSSGSLP